MPLDLTDKRVQLSGFFARDIQMFTRHTPMEIEDILEALCFTAGHALAQKAAKKFATEKELRERCIRAIDDGISTANSGKEASQIILPPGPRH